MRLCEKSTKVLAEGAEAVRIDCETRDGGRELVQLRWKSFASESLRASGAAVPEWNCAGGVEADLGGVPPVYFCKC